MENFEYGENFCARGSMSATCAFCNTKNELTLAFASENCLIGREYKLMY